jgi:phage baseplate assembly protein W
MAFNPQLINPIDLNPNLAVGVNLPFSGPSVFTSNYLTSQAIKNNLINYFLTNPGEIPLNPTFGGGLRAFIFQQISENSLDGLKENVSLKLETYFPNVIINSLDVLTKR